jgi:hypothetical protein
MGRTKPAVRYEWMAFELRDQMTRDHNGGEMLQYGKQSPTPEEEFMLARMGDELRSVEARSECMSMAPTGHHPRQQKLPMLNG